MYFANFFIRHVAYSEFFYFAILVYEKKKLYKKIIYTSLFLQTFFFGNA